MDRTHEFNKNDIDMSDGIQIDDKYINISVEREGQGTRIIDLFSNYRADEYNETIVRQMVECIKVHKDKRIEVIFGGGVSFLI